MAHGFCIKHVTFHHSYIIHQSKNMRSTILTGILLLNLISAGAQGLKEIILPFNYLQSASFEYDVQDKIDEAYRLLNQGEKARLVLYTEQERLTVSQGELQSLTEKRAKLVNAYLAARKQMSYADLKEVIPFLENDINNSTEINDRFSDVIHRPLPGLSSVLLNKSEENIKFYTHVNEDAINRNCQEFAVLIGVETKFYTEGGILIKIQPHSFVYETGENEKLSCMVVNLCVQEFLTYGDMLKADLVTHSNGKMLETGGMVYMEATCTGKKLKIANGKTIQIVFPADEKKPGMQAFNGVKNESISHWVLQKGGNVNFTKAEEPGPGNKNEIMLIDLNPDMGYERSGVEEWDYDGEGNYEDRKLTPEEIAYDSLSNLYDYYADDDIYQMTDGNLLTTANLGWINCDRFYNVEQKTELLVSSGRKETICYRLVFRDIRSIIPAYQYDAKGNFMFDNIPSGQSATLLAFYISKDKKNALFGYKEVTLGKIKKEEVELKELSPDALKNMFAEVFPQ